MKFNLTRIRNIRTEINDITGLVDDPSYPTDENRRIFFFTEVDTLMTVLNLTEQRAYKECFILLRTVLEKFLFFWLMFEGRKYRWTITFSIIPTKSHEKPAKQHFRGCQTTTIDSIYSGMFVH